jgi:uncharacterized cupin superfamily protein
MNNIRTPFVIHAVTKSAYLLQQTEQMMPPVRLANPSTIPSSQLEDWGPIEEPEGERIGWVRGREHVSVFGGVFRVGVWECSPSRWRRRVMEPEFAHFVAGRARFIPDQGEPFDINPGDAVWFPANTTGMWDITETLRKTYVIIASRGVVRKLYTLLRRVSSRQA